MGGLCFVEVREGSKVDFFEVMFIDVSSHYYLKNNGSDRFTFYEVEAGDYLELTSIEYYESGIGNILINSVHHDWANDYYSKANFLLEIWSSVLFIEANALKINDITYKNLL